MTEILSLLTAIMLCLIVIILYRIIAKKFFAGIQWVYPASFLFGYALSYMIYDGDDYIGTMKSILLYAFIISMIVINIKAIRKGAKSRMEHGKRMISDLKDIYGDVKENLNKKSTKKKKIDVDNQNDSDTKNKTDIQEGDVNGENTIDQ